MEKAKKEKNNIKETHIAKIIPSRNNNDVIVIDASGDRKKIGFLSRYSNIKPKIYEIWEIIVYPHPKNKGIFFFVPVKKYDDLSFLLSSQFSLHVKTVYWGNKILFTINGKYIQNYDKYLNIEKTQYSIDEYGTIYEKAIIPKYQKFLNNCVKKHKYPSDVQSYIPKNIREEAKKKYDQYIEEINRKREEFLGIKRVIELSINSKYNTKITKIKKEATLEDIEIIPPINNPNNCTNELKFVPKKGEDFKSAIETVMRETTLLTDNSEYNQLLKAIDEAEARLPNTRKQLEKLMFKKAKISQALARRYNKVSFVIGDKIIKNIIDKYPDAEKYRNASVTTYIKRSYKPIILKTPNTFLSIIIYYSNYNDNTTGINLIKIYSKIHNDDGRKEIQHFLSKIRNEKFFKENTFCHSITNINYIGGSYDTVIRKYHKQDLLNDIIQEIKEKTKID